MNNIKEARKLIKRYESITIDEIKENWSHASATANLLTRYGSHPKSCTLCDVAEGLVKGDECVCSKCIYGENTACFEGDNSKTYYRICNAQTPRQLLNAFRARAKHMSELLEP